MSIGLAIAGGLTQGLGQGISDDVAQLIKDRADELANQRQVGLLGIQHGYQMDAQASQQAFQGTQADKQIAANKDLEAQRESSAATLADKNNAAAMDRTKITEAGAAARANIGQDEASPVGNPVPMKDGTLWQQWDDGTWTQAAGPDGKALIAAPKGAEKLPPNVAAAVGAGKDIMGGFSPAAATNALGWINSQTAQPNQASAPQSAPSGAPQAGAPKIPLAPADPKQRVPGQAYSNGTGGVGVWTGNGWQVQAQQPPQGQ